MHLISQSLGQLFIWVALSILRPHLYPLEERRGGPIGILVDAVIKLFILVVSGILVRRPRPGLPLALGRAPLRLLVRFAQLLQFLGQLFLKAIGIRETLSLMAGLLVLVMLI